MKCKLTLSQLQRLTVVAFVILIGLHVFSMYFLNLFRGNPEYILNDPLGIFMHYYFNMAVDLEILTVLLYIILWHKINATKKKADAIEKK